MASHTAISRGITRRDVSEVERLLYSYIRVCGGGGVAFFDNITSSAEWCGSVGVILFYGSEFVAIFV